MIRPSPWQGRWATALWLMVMLACGIVIARGHYTADLSAFLPSTPTRTQQLLLEQLRDGLASRLILIGIEGGDATTHARISKQMAQRLRADPAFVTVSNGEPVNAERDRAYWFNNRYLLSPAVDPARFSVEGLNRAIADSIELIASPAGMLTRSLLARDPTGETMQLLHQLDSGTRPLLIDGTWASRDGARAVMLARTGALGSDTDAQQQAMHTIQAVFDDVRGTDSNVRLAMTGPGVFSVTSRDTIKREVHRLSLISVTIIIIVLLLVYRSLTALVLGLLPVVSGVVAGIAAVALGFGVVHGVTLGFGTALIGEAVDYSIYLFVQSEQGGADAHDWVQRFWPTIRLGVLTSIGGFLALLLSSFPGLAQLGLYAVVGLIFAALVTRFVLPHLLPANFRIHDVSAIGRALSSTVHRANMWRWPAVLLVLSACAVLITHHDRLWNHSLSSLNPVPAAEAAMDTQLRADLGAPDTRYLVVASGPNRETVLQQAEKISATLQKLMDAGVLAAYESPSRYLPSRATQQARQSSLPTADQLQARLPQALEGLPLRAQRLAAFIEDVERARTQPLLQAGDLQQTSMAMAVDALLMERATEWRALLPLMGPAGGNIDAERIRHQLREATPQALLVDMKTESDQLYAGYLREAIVLSLTGLASIVVLLLVTLRSFWRVLRIIAPLAAAVVTVAAALVLLGQQMTLLHLVGMLLVVAVGSNYALFFDRPGNSDATTAIAPRTLASMLLANITTVAGFGLLAFSSVVVLKALGETVAPGVVLALIYAAIFARTVHD